MAFTLKNPRALTIVQTCIIMLIFCLAGCAAGSCLSYGHSCWGAHGKRSDIQDAPDMRILTAKALSSGSSQHGIAPFPKAQWILPRLITGYPTLPLTDKYRVRWSGFSKDKAYMPRKWEHDAAPISDENVESIRIPLNNGEENNERKISDTQIAMRSMNEKFANTPEDLLISSDEYEKPMNDPQKLNIFKFLNEGDGDTK